MSRDERRWVWDRFTDEMETGACASGEFGCQISKTAGQWLASSPGQRAVVHGAPRAPGARQTPEIEWGVLPFSTFPRTLPEAAKGPPAKTMAPGTSEAGRKNSPAPLKSSHGASRIPRFFGGGHWQYAEPSHLGDWSSAATSCVLGDGPEATMKTDFKFSNLLGTVYCQGNLLFSPDGTHLFSPVGNRVTVFNLVEYACTQTEPDPGWGWRDACANPGPATSRTPSPSHTERTSRGSASPRRATSCCPSTRMARPC